MQKAILLEVVRRLKPATTNHSLPVLGNVLIIRDSSGWHFHSTNLDLYISVTVHDAKPIGRLAEKFAAARIQREAAMFLIPYATLSECAKAADKETEIEILPDLTRYCHGIRFQLAGATCILPAAAPSPEEYPTVPTHDGCHSAILTHRHIAAFRVGGRCISTDDSRYILRGAYWGNVTDQTSAIAATDGRRLYIAEGLPPAPVPELIIPDAAIPLLSPGMCVTVFTDVCYPGTPEERVTATRLVFIERVNSLTVRIHARAIEGNYPNYRQVIPSEYRFAARFDREQITKVIETLQRTLTERLESIYLTVGTQCVTFSMTHRERGTGKVVCPSIIAVKDSQFQTHGFTISFNPVFVLDALRMGFDTLLFQDEGSPGVFIHPRRPNEKYILMPTRSTVEAAPKPEAVAA